MARKSVGPLKTPTDRTPIGAVTHGGKPALTVI